MGLFYVLMVVVVPQIYTSIHITGLYTKMLILLDDSC